MDKSDIFVKTFAMLPDLDIYYLYIFPSVERRETMPIFTAAPQEDLQALLDSVPAGSTVRLAEGVYRQKLKICTPGIRIEGAGADKTELVFDDYARRLDELGRELNTFRTWTVAVCADGISMRDLAIVNDALDPAEKARRWL